MDKNYGGIIWTKHALSRLAERNIKQGDAWAAFIRPDSSRFSKNKNAYVYIRSWDDEEIEIVASKNKEGQWIILSVWSKKKVVKNRKDYKASFLGKFVAKLFGKS